MAMKREMEVTITPDGQVSFQVKCVPGAECEAFSKFLEDALGGEVIERQRTAEFYQEPEKSREKLTTQG